jgi:prophage regulatory protein
MQTQPTAPAAPENLIRLPDVMRRIGLKQSRIYQLISTGDFPAPVSLTGGRAVAWKESQISSWIASRQSARPSKVGDAA